MDNKKRWLESFILNYREKYEALDPEKKSVLLRCNYDFNPKCQLELIETVDPNYQILIVTHFEDEQDLSITLHDPVQYKDLVIMLDNVLKNEKWNKKISSDIVSDLYIEPSESDFYYRKYLEFFFINLSQDINNKFQVYQRSTPFIISKTSIVQHDRSRDFAWEIYGDLSNMDQERIIENIIKDANEWLKEKDSPLPPEPDKIIGYITYFFPPIWVGGLPTFQEKVDQSTKPHHDKVLSIDYKDSDLIVYKDGRIALTEPDINKALAKFNKIMVVATFNDLPAYAIRKIDLERISFDSITLEPRDHYGRTHSIRSILEDDRGGWSKVPLPLDYREKISVEKLNEIVDIASKLDEQIERDLILLYLEAYTHYRETEFIPSFVMSWVVIEKILNEHWRDYLDSKGIKGKRKKKLIESSDWTISIKIETLNLSGKLEDEKYEKLNSLRKKRNDFMHEVKTITQEDAKSCLLISKELLERAIKP